MSVNGLWSATMASPAGPQKGDLTLSADSGVLTGTMAQMGNTMEIENGTVSDDGDLAWEINITKPMPIKVSVTAKYDGGDKISGRAKLGAFGEFDIDAVRA